MIYNLLITLFRCLSALNSFLYNPRNTEDFVRPLWTALLCHLCDGSSQLLPSSEFRLYRSALDEDEANQTNPDGNAKDVIPDFIVLLPIDKETPSPTWKANNMNRLMKCINSPFLALVDMYAPLLVELKRGPSRHHHRIDKFVQNFHELMTAARIQVQQQGDCLFSSAKFSNQTRVMLIAATGQWWSLKIHTRTFAQIFDVMDYASAKFDGSLLETDIDIYEDIFFPEDKDMKMKWEKSIKDQEARLLERQIDTQRQVEEREQRYLKRNENKDKYFEAREKLNNWMKIHQLEGRDFNEDNINKYYQLSKDAGLHPAIPSERGFCGVAFSSDKIVQSFHYGNWTLPMKIGSPASNAFLDLIKDELKKAEQKSKY